MAHDKQNAEHDETQAKLREGLRYLIEQLSGGDKNSVLGMLLQAFFGSLFGIDPDQEGYDDARTADEYQAAERDYNGRSESERKQYSQYEKPSRFVPQSVDDMKPLVALREKYGDDVKAVLPVRGDVRFSSDFGDRVHPITGKHTHHDGLDVAPKVKGTQLPIVAPMPGMVKEIRFRGGYGLTVDMIDIYGVTHRFAHLSAVGVKAGDVVEQGEDIATMGSTGRSTGVHLHYEQRDAKGNKRAPQIEGRVIREGEPTAELQHNHDAPAKKAVPSAKAQAVAAVALVRGKIESEDAPKLKAKPAHRDNGKFEVADVADTFNDVAASTKRAFSSATSKIGSWLS